MECREIKELISAWADGEVTPEESRLVEGHVAECPSCRRLARRMRALGEGMSGMTCDVSPRFRKDLLARMERDELLPRRRPIGLSLRWAAVPVAAAAVLALFVLSAREAGKAPSVPTAGPRLAERGPATGDAEPAAGRGAPSERPGTKAPAAAAPAEPPRMALARPPGGEGDLSREDREIIAYLEVLEDPQALDDENDLDDWYPPAPGRERG